MQRQTSDTIYSYINKICDKCTSEGKSGPNLRRQLELIAKPYVSLIVAAENNFETIEVVIDKLRQDYPNNQKLDLIHGF